MDFPLPEVQELFTWESVLAPEGESHNIVVAYDWVSLELLCLGIVHTEPPAIHQL